MNLIENFNKILTKYNDLSNKLSSGDFKSKDFVANSKEYAELDPIVKKINQYNKILDEIKDTELLLTEVTEEDIVSVAREELSNLRSSLEILEQEIKIAMLPKDEEDAKGVIIEIRAGAGGEEAALFAAQLFNMYEKFALRNKWNFEILSISSTDLGGYKEASALINGNNVFAKLKFEAGVHRVQRVPATESSGRVHTSTVTVAILPQAEEVDVKLDDKDIKIETCRASGAGGQHVNTTDSAVKITHLPTGITVEIQDEKSQHKNKAKAMKVLRARVYEFERSKRDEERASSRRGQVGSGDRSESVRTYNFPEGRVSDRRLRLTLYAIDDIIGEGKIDPFIEGLILADQARKLEEIF